MKNKFFITALMLFLFCLPNSAEAGSYFKKNFSLYLGGKVHIRFDYLLLGWTKSQEFIDKIRYKLTCLKGDAILTNVDFLDSAKSSTPGLRWRQSSKGLHWDFSARFNRMDGKHKIAISKTNFVEIKPFSLDTAIVRFHIKTPERTYKVVWAPKTGKIYSTW